MVTNSDSLYTVIVTFLMENGVDTNRTNPLFYYIYHMTLAE